MKTLNLGCVRWRSLRLPWASARGSTGSALAQLRQLCPAQGYSSCATRVVFLRVSNGNPPAHPNPSPHSPLVSGGLALPSIIESRVINASLAYNLFYLSPGFYYVGILGLDFIHRTLSSGSSGLGILDFITLSLITLHCFCFLFSSGSLI